MDPWRLVEVAIDLDGVIEALLETLAIRLTTNLMAQTVGAEFWPMNGHLHKMPICTKCGLDEDAWCK